MASTCRCDHGGRCVLECGNLAIARMRREVCHCLFKPRNVEQRMFRTCDACGKVTDVSDNVARGVGYFYCNRCSQEQLRCIICGQSVARGSSRSEYGYVCRVHAKYPGKVSKTDMKPSTRICDTCGKDKPLSRAKTCEKGHFICMSCGAGHTHCKLCGQVLR